MQTYKTIDEYIAPFPPETAETLNKIRKIIKENAPKAVEKISYGMPTFWQGENLIHFAAMKNHIGIYPTPSGIVAFAEKLQDYKTSKGAFQILNNKPVPYELIAEITRFRVSEANGK